SLLTPRDVRRLSLAVFAVATLLLAYTLVGGIEIKGARRWIALPMFSLQPSEFVKPCFAVIAAWLFAQHKITPRFPGHWIAILMLFGIVALLIKQPDLGMAVVVIAVFFIQFFLAGLNLFWIVAFVLAVGGGMVGAYFTLPHVTSRV